MSWDQNAKKPYRPYPNLPVPRGGKPVALPSGIILPPLNPEENRLARDVRLSTLLGEDFRGMIENLRGHDIFVRPAVSEKKDGSWSFTGMSFTRGQASVIGSRVGVRMVPNGDPKAPVLPDDGPFLLALRDEHDEATASLREERSRIAEALRLADVAADEGRPHAEILSAAGVTVSSTLILTKQGGFTEKVRMVRARTEDADILVDRQKFFPLLLAIRADCEKGVIQEIVIDESVREPIHLNEDQVRDQVRRLVDQLTRATIRDMSSSEGLHESVMAFRGIRASCMGVDWANTDHPVEISTEIGLVEDICSVRILNDKHMALADMLETAETLEDFILKACDIRGVNPRREGEIEGPGM